MHLALLLLHSIFKENLAEPPPTPLQSLLLNSITTEESSTNHTEK
jgi:hypothetical protein